MKGEIQHSRLRRAAAGSLILLTVFNTIGYYFALVGAKVHHDFHVISRLDDGRFDRAETVTFRIPLTLPYGTYHDEFRRVDGEFEYENQHYRMVEQRYQLDTLTIICVRDHHSGRIKQALKEYVKTFTDTPSGASSTAKIKTHFTQDFIQQTFDLQLAGTGWSAALSFSQPASLLRSGSATPPDRPPQQS